MADLSKLPEKILIQKFKEICLSNASIFKQIGLEKTNGVRTRQIYYNRSKPVGKVFPTVNYSVTMQASQEQIPADACLLTITVYSDKDEIESYKTLSELLGSIHAKINNQPQQFEEVDTENKKGLHCVQCTRIFQSECDFDEINKVYYMTANYQMTISTHKDNFGVANNETWNPLI